MSKSPLQAQRRPAIFIHGDAAGVPLERVDQHTFSTTDIVLLFTTISDTGSCFTSQTVHCSALRFFFFSSFPRDFNTRKTLVGLKTGHIPFHFLSYSSFSSPHQRHNRRLLPLMNPKTFYSTIDRETLTETERARGFLCSGHCVIFERETTKEEQT